jgi:hypothetical protein
MGPDNSYFYLGPGDVPGHVAYGNNGTEIHMQYLSQQKREGSTYVTHRLSGPVVTDSLPFAPFCRSRYFMTQSGRSYKWRITPQRMEVCQTCLWESNNLTESGFHHQCMDGRTTLAVWELNNHPDGEYYARLTIKTSGFPLVTEILTTLILNRMSRWLAWET